MGDTIAQHIEEHPSCEVWGFEPNPCLISDLRARFDSPSIHIEEAAAWISDGTATLYLGNPLSSTLLKGKRQSPRHPEFAIDYTKSVTVRTIDFARWLAISFTRDDEIIVKMDIEGAEYAVLSRLLASGAIDLIDTLFCEFHHDRFPIAIDKAEGIIEEVARRVELLNWQ